MIAAKDLRKSFGSITAVDGLSFDIAAGETFGLLGPNGAGKSTTIALLVGLLSPDSGTVAIADQPDPTRPAARRLLGVAPQSLAIYEQFTPRENLSFFGKLFGLSGSALRERVAWALDFAGLTDRGNDRVRTFSGGMKRRLNLACALVHDPQVILLDEPTVGVDPQSRNHMFESIERLRREGRTILYTTHYMEEARRLCDRVAIMDRGRILALDTVDGLIARYGGDSVIRGELETPPPPDVVRPDLLPPTPWKGSGCGGNPPARSTTSNAGPPPAFVSAHWRFHVPTWNRCSCISPAGACATNELDLEHRRQRPRATAS